MGNVRAKPLEEETHVETDFPLRAELAGSEDRSNHELELLEIHWSDGFIGSW
jgi:hypothetical protein